MKKLGTLLVLMSLTVISVGCGDKKKDAAPAADAGAADGAAADGAADGAAADAAATDSAPPTDGGAEEE